VKYFKNRLEAAYKLLEELKKLKLNHPVVFALPRGGVEIGSIIAQGLSAPLDLLLTRKLEAPFNEELALGAIVEGNPPHVVLNKDMIAVLKVEWAYLEKEKKTQLTELERRQDLYRGGKVRGPVRGKNVVLVDDGIATGATVKAAIEGLKSDKPEKIIVAVPVADEEALNDIKKEVDKVICLNCAKDFQAVAQFYRDFHEVTDDEVIKLLKQK